ncbi:hypothetical protein KSP40_PGU019022 [Platanthera guangdongensis]|uniref:DUF8040 domain-containing protein n=1 Tax=Platanthera guangdongensis TaxID=2320717 RepID=A0ABR2ML57_9ASPA
MDLLHSLEEKCGFQIRRIVFREELALTVYILSQNGSMRKTYEHFQHSMKIASKVFARGLRALL